METALPLGQRASGQPEASEGRRGNTSCSDKAPSPEGCPGRDVLAESGPQGHSHDDGVSLGAGEHLNPWSLESSGSCITFSISQLLGVAVTN